MGQFFILRSKLQQEYNGLLVNALNRIFKSNLSLNNFKWLLTKVELSCVRKIIPRSRKRLWNGYPVLNQELQNHDPFGRHIPGYEPCPVQSPPHPTPDPPQTFLQYFLVCKKLKYSIKLLNSMWPFFFLTWPPSSKFSTTFLHDTNSSKPEISVDFTSRTKLVQSSRRTLAAFSLKLAWQSAQSLTNNRAPFESAFSSMSSSFLLLIVWTGLWANLNTPSRFEKAMISEVERAPVYVCAL